MHFSQIVEDLTGVPFTQSHGVSESYRWFAPELCVGKGTLSTCCDIYAFAMTVVEVRMPPIYVATTLTIVLTQLLTHEQPYAYIKQTTEVVIKSHGGERPQRPVDSVIVDRGLDDALWNLLASCWVGEPRERPDIRRVLDTLLA